MTKGFVLTAIVLLATTVHADIKCQPVLDKEIAALGLGSFDKPNLCTAKATMDNGAKISSGQGSTSIEVTSMPPLPNGATGRIAVKRTNLAGIEESKLIYVMPDCSIREIVLNPGTNSGAIAVDQSKCDKVQALLDSRGEAVKTPGFYKLDQIGLATHVCLKYKGKFSASTPGDGDAGGIGSRTGTSGK